MFQSLSNAKMQSGRWIHRTVCCGCHELRGWLEIGEAPRRSHAGGRDVSFSAPDLKSMAIRSIRLIPQFRNSYCALLSFFLELDMSINFMFFFFGVSIWGPVAKSSWCSQWQELKRQSLIRFARRQQQRRCIWRRFTDWDCCRESLYFLASWIGRMIQTDYNQMIWNRLLRHQHERD